VDNRLLTSGYLPVRGGGPSAELALYVLIYLSRFTTNESDWLNGDRCLVNHLRV